MAVDPSWWTNIPPVLENDEDKLREYIIDPKLNIEDTEMFFFQRTPDITKLYYAPPLSLSGISTEIPERHPETGEILDYVEIQISNPDSTARNSLSLSREPGLPSHATRGSSVNYPFWPGGFDRPEIEMENLITKDSATAIKENSLFEKDLLTCPPGFKNGLIFSNNKKTSIIADGDTASDITETKTNVMQNEINENLIETDTIHLLSMVEKEQDIFNLWDNTTTSDGTINDPQTNEKKSIYGDGNNSNDIDKMIDATISDDGNWKTFKNRPVLQIANATTNVVTQLEWAESIDISLPVKDFDKIIPEPAHTYPFELDPFQQHAIVKLEKRNHVFVAAHTSAGKTVVAEYAVALSQKHMTRTIYTSPIKALSNQKYRDFKNAFKDVGLITGDIQIDPTSSCLIMTTEILRSMLYCGSEVTRDLEYVIFDEVHYITDVDRGHVWEEVLILLPDHVNIVMLSATVPNTLEFANWVGRTKKRKVYVISTLKRPVPLMHYLYTGCGGESKNDIFLLVNENGEFSLKGYRDAVNAKDKTGDKSGDKSVPRHNHHHSSGNVIMSAKQEQQLWIGLIDWLKRNDKLPVVAFTLSRKRCDGNLKALQSCDLCTAKEAHYIHVFFQKCLTKLNPEDRDIPQVLVLQDSLKRGIGVHHSGILPILKEIVEMLFQSGYVKLLFATETFAMGVNMPARTVIFDSHRKFDGTEVRVLRPAEYTQMAGRAGRRGLDKNGTVILLCKNKMPFEMDLRHMILGKPMRLESKFRLTYAMILNLLRIESVTVEDMMTHSFKEFNSQALIPHNTEQLKIAEEQISSMQEIGNHMKPLTEFYNLAINYINEWNAIMTDVTSEQKMFKDLKPGRVVLITFDNHFNKLAIILSSNIEKKIPVYKVLVLDNVTPSSYNTEINLTTAMDKQRKPNYLLDDVNVKRTDTPMANVNRTSELWLKMISLIPQHKHFIPKGGVGGHTILTIQTVNIIEITKMKINIEAEKILQNYVQRQIPRFRGTPPSPTVLKVVTDLYNLNNGIINGTEKLPFIDVGQEYKFNVSLKKLKSIRKELDACLKCTNVSNFEHEFAIVYDRKQLESRREELKFKISKESLSLYPDYLSKLDVLRQLNYIDDLQGVTMKGRVACEMGSNELIITELVLSNTFNELEPAEIAALLSSLVFQAKTEGEPQIPESLKESVKKIILVDKDITLTERTFNASSHDELMEKERLNFGLVQVVYEWAKNKPFAEIMKITDDIQEGIVVRCIQQLNETIQNVRDAARIIGNPALQNKMEAASTAIQRDIVFAASLYFET